MKRNGFCNFKKLYWKNFDLCIRKKKINFAL